MTPLTAGLRAAIIMVIICNICCVYSKNEVSSQEFGSCGSSPWADKLAAMIEPVLDECGNAANLDAFADCAVELLGITADGGHAFIEELKAVLVDVLSAAVAGENGDTGLADGGAPASEFKCPCVKDDVKRDEL